MTVPPELRRAAAHVFVDDVHAPVLDDTDRHHLVRVLRLARGEAVGVSDGAGSWRVCRHLGDGELDVVGAPCVTPAPAVEIGVAFAPVKGDRVEWVVQKLTEMGVDRIVPMFTARSVVRWDAERASKQLDRLTRVAREAAMQCRRVRLPVLEPAASFDAVVRRPGACLAEPGGEPLDMSHPLVLVGPEGGFTDDELVAGVPRVALPGGILRAETAAVTAAVLLAAARDVPVDGARHTI